MNGLVYRVKLENLRKINLVEPCLQHDFVQLKQHAVWHDP